MAGLTELAAREGRTTPIEVTLPGGAGIDRPEDVEPYAQAGVTRLIVAPWKRSREALDGLRRFADTIVRPG